MPYALSSRRHVRSRVLARSTNCWPGNRRSSRTRGQLVHGLTLGGCRSSGNGAFVHRCSGVGNANTRAALGDREAARGMRRNVAMAQHDTSLHIAARTTASGLPDAHQRTSAYAVNDHDVVERQARCPASTRTRPTRPAAFPLSSIIPSCSVCKLRTHLLGSRALALKIQKLAFAGHDARRFCMVRGQFRTPADRRPRACASRAS